MKRLFLILSFSVCIGSAQAQEWWQGTLGPAPSVPEGVEIGPPTERSGGQGGHSSDSYDSLPSQQERRNDQPGPQLRALYSILNSISISRLVASWREQAHTQQIKDELARLSMGFQIRRAQPTIELTPRGDGYFNTSPDSGERPFGAIMVASLSGIGTPASRIPVVNLNRAAAIMQVLRPSNIGSMSDEDISYLASQSALALEGAPLSVEIRDLAVGREDDVRRLVQQVQDVETVRAAAERATTERLRVEEKLAKAQKDLPSRKEDSEGPKSQRDENLLKLYKTVYNTETNLKVEVNNKIGKVTEVWEAPPTVNLMIAPLNP